MNRLKPGDKARVKEYRFDISILTETETDPDELILSIIQAVKADGRSIAASPIPNPPNKDYPIQREPIEPVQEEESPWISVEDRLPEINAQDNLALEMGESKPCLVWVNRFGVRFATHYDKGGFKAWSVGGITGLDNKDITHWMPLPKPPISRLKSEIEELKRKA